MKTQWMVAMLATPFLLGGKTLIAQTQVKGTIVTVAGNGNAGFAGDGGLSISAKLYVPYGVAVDNSGNFYVADTGNNRVRKINVNNGFTITTIAGSGTRGYCGDRGPALKACLDNPTGVAVDSVGNVYIAENLRVRKVSPAGTITTLAGNGSPSSCGDGQPAYLACLHVPRGVAVDTNRNVYIADEPENRVRKVLASDGTITTVAGTGIWGFSGDGGAAIFAELNLPTGVALDSTGNLYIADWNNHRIRKVDPSGTITTVAGTGSPSFCGDNGPATRACLRAPYSVGTDGLGNVYIADQGNVRVRKITVTTGIITTVAGGGVQGLCDGCIATKASIASPVGVALYPFAAGTTPNLLYIADPHDERIRRVAF